MNQTSLDDEDLFGEASAEMRDDVDESLAAARAALPDADAIWETDATNVLGVLNGLKSALDTGDAAEHLRDAKKWFTVGQRADAFDDPGHIEREIEELEETIASIESAAEEVNGLTSTLPALRGSLESPSAEEGGEAAPTSP